MATQMIKPTLSAYPNGCCPDCGGPLIGDGFRDVLHCDLAETEEVWSREPDSKPVLRQDP
jgi:hypothetical protein